MTYAMVNLQDYATFETIEDMDQNVKQFNKELSRPYYETLNLLKQYSVKVVGVSHLKIKTIADRLNKSTRTIERHVKYLKENGFITVVNTSRVKSGGKGANSYVINTTEYRQKWIKNKMSGREMSGRDDAEKGGQYQSRQAFNYIKVRKETMYSLKLLTNLSSTSKRKYRALKRTLHIERQAAVINAKFKNRAIPSEIYNRFKPFFSPAQLNALYRTANGSLEIYELSQTEKIDAIIYAMESLVKAMQRHQRGQGEPVYNIYAYLNRTLTHIGFNAEHGDMYAYTDAESYREFIAQ